MPVRDYNILEIKMKWRIIEDVVKVGIRVELADGEERVFATSVFYNQIEGIAGDTGESILRVDLSHVVNGEYKTFYTVFGMDQFGENFDLDCVKGINIVIDREKENEGELNWRNGSWGYIIL